MTGKNKGNAMVLPASPGARRGVFISYSRKDGEDRAREIRALLERENIPVWQDRTGMEGGRDWWEQIRQALNQMEFLVLVMTPAAIASPIVGKEWRYARQQGVCVYPVIAAPELDFDALPRWMRDTHWYDLGHQQAKFLNDVRTRCQVRRVPFMVEDMPEGFVPRDEEFGKLKALLLTGKRGDPVALTAALRGAGGYGKTTLAKALCHDEDIQYAFDDGVLWVTLGETPSQAHLLTILVDLIETLSGERPGFEGLDAAAARFREELTDRDILLVIDDVWRSADLRPFLQGGERCARLVTTRRAETLPQSARSVPVDEMRHAEAQELIGQGLALGCEKELSAVTARLGDWPLLLKLVNAQLRKRTTDHKQPLPAAIAWVRTALDKRGLIAFDARDPQQCSDAVARTLEVSLAGLTESDRERLLDLAVFPEDLTIPFAVLECYWGHTGGLDAFDVEDTCLRLYGESLLLQCDLNERYLRLHDAVRAWLIQRPGNTTIASRHARLLTAYQRPGTRWEDTPDDGYMHAHLAEHLAGAARRDDLRRLLLSLDWMHVRLGKGQADPSHPGGAHVAELLHDYDFLAEAPEINLVRQALRQSTHVLDNQPAALEQQLYGRLGASELAPIGALCESISSRGRDAPFFPLRPALMTPGILELTLVGHENSVNGALLLDKGRRALSWSTDHNLRLWDLTRGEVLATLTGHEDTVDGALPLHEGRRALSWSTDNTLRLWDLARGEALATLTGHEGVVTGALLLDDGRQALSWSTDNTLLLWDLTRGEALATLAGHDSSVIGALLLDEGRRALSWSADSTLRLWDLTCGEALATLAGHESSVFGALLLDKGRRALSWSADNTLRLWDLTRDEAMATLAGHEGRINGSLLLDEGQRALSWSADSTLRLWDLTRGVALATLAGHDSWINGVNGALLLDEGRRALSWSADSTLRLWDLTRCEAQATLAGHGNWVSGALLLDEGRRALSWSSDHTLRLWDLTHGEAAATVVGHKKWWVDGALLLDEGRRALSWSPDSTLRLWDLTRGEALATLAGHEDWVKGALLLDEGRALSWSTDHTLRLWDLTRGEVLATLAGHENSVNGVLLLDEGRRALSWSTDNTMRLWDLTRGEALATLTSHEKSVEGALLLDEGRRALSWSYDNTLRLWNLTRGEALATLTGHEKSVDGALLLDEGRRALSWSWDSTLRLWDLARGEALATLTGHEGRINGSLLLDKGRRALSWSADSTLRLWDLTRGDALATLAGHEKSVDGALLLDEGRRALSWSWDSTLRLWDLTRGEALATLAGHEGPVDGALLLDEGRRALSWSKDRTMRLWDLEVVREVSTYFTDAAITSVVVGLNTTRIFAGDASGRIHLLGLCAA